MREAGQGQEAERPLLRTAVPAGGSAVSSARLVAQDKHPRNGCCAHPHLGKTSRRFISRGYGSFEEET